MWNREYRELIAGLRQSLREMRWAIGMLIVSAAFVSTPSAHAGHPVLQTGASYTQLPLLLSLHVLAALHW